MLRKKGKALLALVLAASLLPQMPPIHANDVGDTFKATMKTHSAVFNGKSDQYAGKTVILHSNDVHGQIDGYAYIAELEDDFEEAGAEVIMVDAGDFAQGNPNVSFSKGAKAIGMMNAAGYEYITLGNHEFDYGYARLKKNLKKAKFKVLCADIEKKNKKLFDGHEIYTTKSGMKIGFFGMITPETASKANPSLIKGLTFLNNTSKKKDLYDCASDEVAALEKKNADIIVSISHLGMDQESAGDGHRSVDLYNNVSGIDIILDGHSHDEMTEGPKKEPIQSAGSKFDSIGVVVIDDAEKKITDHYLIDTEGLEKDEAVEEKANNIIEAIDEKYGKTIAKSKVNFASEKTENRCYETNTGDLITDAMTWEILKNKKDLKVPVNKVVTIVNGGSIRAGLSVGKVSRKDIQNVLPFGNTLTVAYVTGKELLEILEASTFESPEASGGYPQTKGIKFTIDTTKAYDQGEAYPGTTYYAPASIQRVSIESINGKPFKKSATYAVVTNDFISAGGDTYYKLKAADSSVDTGFVIDEVVCDYITDELKGVLTKKKYGSPRGDVTIIPASEDK